jgi:3-oxoacyl-[acyl-carrier-protein] synthase II
VEAGRVVITGIGAIMPGSTGKDEVWHDCLNGISAIGEIKAFDSSSSTVGVAGEVSDEVIRQFLPEDKQGKVDRFSALAMIAAREALDDSGIDYSSMRDKVGVYLGSGYTGRMSIDKYNKALYRGGVKRVHPRLMQNNISNAASGEVAIYLGLNGANLAYSVGYSSGSFALVQAYNALRLNQLDAIIAGGAEAPILPLVLEEMKDLGEMSRRREDPTKVSRPFDRDRDGFVASEGSCIIALEQLESALSRGAKIYAEFKGYSVQYDMERGAGKTIGSEAMVRTIDSALEDANMPPERVDYISAHGLSTRDDDRAETRALKDSFGAHAERLAVSSIKSVTGYSIAASEALEVAVSALTMKDSRVPPTMNLETADEECDLDYVPNKLREMEVDVAVSNTFGIDGNYSSIILEKYNE